MHPGENTVVTRQLSPNENIRRHKNVLKKPVVNNIKLLKYPLTKASSHEPFIVSCSRGPAGPEIPQLLILAVSSAHQPLRSSWLHRMWTQLLVVVGYYGLSAPRLCLAFREEPSLVVTFKLFRRKTRGI